MELEKLKTRDQELEDFIYKNENIIMRWIENINMSINAERLDMIPLDMNVLRYNRKYQDISDDLYDEQYQLEVIENIRRYMDDDLNNPEFLQEFMIAINETILNDLLNGIVSEICEYIYKKHKVLKERTIEEFNFLDYNEIIEIILKSFSLRYYVRRKFSQYDRDYIMKLIYDYYHKFKESRILDIIIYYVFLYYSIANINRRSIDKIIVDGDMHLKFYINYSIKTLFNYYKNNNIVYVPALEYGSVHSHEDESDEDIGLEDVYYE